MKIKRAEKYGFCSGVRIADLKVKRFASSGGRGAILGQVVHNERVVEEMEKLGVRTVEEITAVQEPTIVFSAHGVPPSFHESAKASGLKVLDTTCKFVYDIHRESNDALKNGYHLVFIGDPKHREVIGYTHDLDPATYHIVSTVGAAMTIDWSVYPKVKIFYQTTLNAEDFEDVVRTIEQRAKIVDRAASDIPDAIRRKRYRAAEPVRELRGHRREREFGDDFSVRAAEMRKDDRPGAMVAKICHGRQGRDNAGVVGDCAVTERTIEILSDNNPFSANVKFADGQKHRATPISLSAPGRYDGAEQSPLAGFIARQLFLANGEAVVGRRLNDDPGQHERVVVLMDVDRRLH